jgi:poly(3-hydroxyalkanoate) depolymerase
MRGMSRAKSRITFHEIHNLKLRVSRRSPRGASGPPLLIFNGIGASLEILDEFVDRLDNVRTIAFDMPGVGGSELSWLPRRPSALARLTRSLLIELGETEVDVLGVSWGGMMAQQFAHQYPEICRRLILAATSPGQIMVPARPRVLLNMMTPLRHASERYFRYIAGTIYGGDFRTDLELVSRHTKVMSHPHPVAYWNQLFAISGWSSLPWLHRLEQPTLVLAGTDDPIVPRLNARILARLIPDSELQFFDCGHMFLITRAEQVIESLDRFLLPEGQAA